MRRKKTLSSISVAAVALLVAAVPCFAQNQSDESRAEVKSSVLTTDTGLEALFTKPTSSVALRTGFVFIEPKNLLDNSRGEVSSSTLSLAVRRVTSKVYVKENLFSFDLQLRPYNSSKQFRSDESSAEQSTRDLTFVPSRGPKFPN